MCNVVKYVVKTKGKVEIYDIQKKCPRVQIITNAPLDHRIFHKIFIPYTIHFPYKHLKSLYRVIYAQ